MDCANRFGGLTQFALGNIRAYFINSPDDIRHVLLDNHQNYSKNTVQYNALSTITGRGLLTNDGDSWLRNRRLVQPAFARPRLNALDEIIVPAVQRMLDNWQPVIQSGGQLDIDREMMRLTLEIVGKALFSIDLSSEASELTGAVLTALDFIVYQARYMITPPVWAPTPRNLRFKAALRRLDQAFNDIITARQRQGDPGDDLLGMLLRARDEETGLSLTQTEIRDEVITLLIAGHETVASSLTWTWYLLSQRPEKQRLLQAEIDRVLAGRLPASADLPDLTYTAQTFDEALRLYPPAWLITRTAIQADTLSGVSIPARALIIISPYVIHRHPDYWNDPEEFKPERFAGESKQHRFAYIPFGGGPRLCIGNQFAAVEAELILAMVTQKVELKLAPGANIIMDPLVTLRPRYGLPMTAVVR